MTKSGGVRAPHCMISEPPATHASRARATADQPSSWWPKRMREPSSVTKRGVTQKSGSTALDSATLDSFFRTALFGPASNLLLSADGSIYVPLGVPSRRSVRVPFVTKDVSAAAKARGFSS